MCISCWDCDKKIEMLKQGEPCTGEEMMKLTFQEMQFELTQEWIATRKTKFRVFKEAVPSRPADHCKFLAPNGTDSIYVDFL